MKLKDQKKLGILYLVLGAALFLEIGRAHV